jgi:hypothetical protein
VGMAWCLMHWHKKNLPHTREDCSCPRWDNKNRAGTVHIPAPTPAKTSPEHRWCRSRNRSGMRSRPGTVQAQTCQLGGTSLWLYSRHKRQSRKQERKSPPSTSDTWFDPRDQRIDRLGRRLRARNSQGNSDPVSILRMCRNYSTGRLGSRTDNPRHHQATRHDQENTGCRP